MSQAPVKSFLKKHFRHFNSAALVDAAEAYRAHLEEKNGKMMITLAGAMSTAELGLSLAEMIRQDKVHAISCTGANLEEDMFNLVAHNSYVRIPNYRDLTPQQEADLVDRHLARVTDTCIPEEEAMRKTERQLLALWQEAEQKGESHPPHYYFYELIRRGIVKKEYQIDPKDSWLVAAAEKNLPLFVPGWEDSTMGNNFAAHILKGNVKSSNTVQNGTDYMIELSKWYERTSKEHPIGFFQIGGGIAGDFPICVVPMIQFDLKRDIPLWSYFCQISDSTTSYGSYSGAVPNEKITWGKLGPESQKFIVESDATIVAPLVFAYVLNW